MQKNIKAAVLTWFMIATASVGAHAEKIVADPIRDYLFGRDLDKDCAFSQFNSLFILDLDINHNGKPVKFLTFNGYGGKATGNNWTAYVPKGNGYVRADDRERMFSFNSSMFYVGYVKSAHDFGLLAYWSGKGGGDLEFYRIVDGRVTARKIASVAYSDPVVEKYFGTPPNWKSVVDHPKTVMTDEDLKAKGYDTDAAISAADAAISSGYKYPELENK